MAIFNSSLLIHTSFLFLLLLLPLLHPCTATRLIKNCSFDAIYQFGDSISDTGNLIREAPIGTATPYGHLPYGMTLSNTPTGRCSDGLLMIDYIAMALQIPLLNPYLKRDSDFSHGVNFAVAGSTALDTTFLAKQRIFSPLTNSSLFVQLGWFMTHLKSICSTETECRQKLGNSLFLVGEIGGNDYNYAFFQGKTMEEVESLIPSVVQKIKDAVTEVIKVGATRVVVPGNFPIRCIPIYLTAFAINDPASYDELKCLKGLNNFAMNHNIQLQGAISLLREEQGSNIDIAYADYYTAYQWVLSHAHFLGLDVNSIEKACCGTGGEYNFNLIKMCGAEGVQVCSNPETYMSWDGVHSTQNGYRLMADWLLRDIKPKIRCFF
ncbi:acetylajmalan esterase-like [Telopea speciosissima]|uniref:acetylajmalan esterase-like n=1 Tax=Telopea speciosissima TaxID=54955 RepID=UPI001CC455A2|nr:acetylajmalan esterase-like [Telopea speciosissima]